MKPMNISSDVGTCAVPEYPAWLGQEVDGAFNASELSGLQCDVVTAPLDLCCGVFVELERAGGPLPPMAQLGDRMLFLVRVGSGAAALAAPSMPVDCESLGIEVTAAGSVLDATDPAATGSWVVPPSAHGADLPTVSTVLTALQAARATTGRREGAR
ncbi:hypothetical protein GCM10009835_06150 [Planosporangium flavigriseum]|uniref:Uncharacterized protein n=1 Tax=Planosporangium flavigriseum TaxID=373681 RepID=A0A8J3LV77_9ACTN|nr:hypothetical protein Pfl04_28580 [Planosporangium flavigriseum]